MTERYEILRAAALGEELPVEARSGLALLLRRGMWAWARAAATPSRTRLPMRSLSSRSIADDEQRAVIRLFAAMATRCTKPRAHERIAQSRITPPRA